MNPNVYSEDGRLGGVFTHKPGQEFARVTPGNLSTSLLDELIDPGRAATEHQVLTDCMVRCGVEIFDVKTFLLEVLCGGNRQKATKMILSGTNRHYCDQLKSLTPEDLSGLLISGYHPNLGQWLIPLCNLVFTRDSFFVIGNKVFIANPHHEVRKREAAIFEAIFTYHNRFKQIQIVSKRNSPWPIEGGDILVLSNKVVAIGGIHRTHSRAAEELTEELLKMGFEVVFRISFEKDGRDKMHLDTTFTIVDHDLCLVHAPVMLGSMAEQATSVLQSNVLNGTLMWERVPTLLDGLKKIGMQLEPIVCGGDDPVSQEREQWWDGCNTVALAPGVVMIYDRCEMTIRGLEKCGFQIVEASSVQSLPSGRTAILLPSNELPKGRGGPHCMTMPWYRN